MRRTVVFQQGQRPIRLFHDVIFAVGQHVGVEGQRPFVALETADVLELLVQLHGAVLDRDLHGQHAGAAGLQAFQDALDLFLTVGVDDFFEVLDRLADVVGGLLARRQRARLVLLVELLLGLLHVL